MANKITVSELAYKMEINPNTREELINFYHKHKLGFDSDFKRYFLKDIRGRERDHKTAVILWVLEKAVWKTYPANWECRELVKKLTGYTIPANCWLKDR